MQQCTNELGDLYDIVLYYLLSSALSFVKMNFTTITISTTTSTTATTTTTILERLFECYIDHLFTTNNRAALRHDSRNGMDEKFHLDWWFEIVFMGYFY